MNEQKIKYFHNLSDEELDTLLKNGGMSWGECAMKYPQPTWCAYPDAVCGVMGCWSLMGVYGKKRRIRSIDDCEGCELLIDTNSNYARRYYQNIGGYT